MKLKYYISYTIYHFRQLTMLVFLLSLSFNCPGSQSIKSSEAYINPNEIWEFGLPFIENYTSDKYRSSPQNWAILEGNDGFIYMGNTYGILQYDGNNWKTIKLENKGLVRSLAKSDGEKIFVGGVHELGCLEPDELGRMQYHSLLLKLPAAYREFGDVWSTLVYDNNTYFLCNKYLFRWNGKEFKIWQAKLKFGGFFKINNALYIESIGLGMHRVNGDSLQLISAGHILQDDKAKIDVMLSYQNNKVLIATANKGLLLFDGERLSSFNQNSNEIFLKHRIYRGICLSNGDYAMATLTSGLYILDGKTGVIKKRLGKKQGLISDVLFSVFEDSYGVIWVGSDKGISKVDWASPFRKLNELSGLAERVRSVSYQNHKFLVDSKGLYQLVKSNLHKNTIELAFQKVEGIESRIKFILPFKDYLLAFDFENIYKIDNKNKAQLIKKEAWALTSIIQSTIDSSKIYAGTLEGQLLECQFSNNQWFIKPILQIEGGIEGIVEELDGDLWLQTHYKGLFLAARQSGEVENETRFKLIKYDTLSGLPSMTFNFPYLFHEKLYATTLSGMYWFNEVNHAFEKDTLLTNQYDKSVDAYGYMGIDRNGNIWQTVKAGFENKVYRLSDNNLSELSEYNLYSNFETYSMEFLDDIILFIGPKGILLYNQNASRSIGKSLTTKLREVYVHNKSVVNLGFNSNKGKENGVAFPNKSNTLKFEYTLPFYIKPEDNTYQYILEGFDKNWSNWTLETKKEYTHLPSGNYTFKVRSKNIFNHVGKQDSYSFAILPPWYSTWWAYISYVFGLVAIVSLIIQQRSKQLLRKNLALEATIKERTSEVVQKNELLEKQTKKLTEQTEQLEVVDKMKAHFLANISHEFRTPLTLIKGPVEQLEKSPKEKLSPSNIQMIKRNANRLLKLVNQLLDLSRLEVGSLKLELSEGNVYHQLRTAASSFTSHAEEQHIEYQVDIPSDGILWAAFDKDKLDNIVYNLLGNAFKFTTDEGCVNLSVSYHKNTLKIKVRDTGCGIPQDSLPMIFDRFYQDDASFSKETEGTGIGLSLVKELVDLMEGEIVVESVFLEGSVFTVNIPIIELENSQKDEKSTSVNTKESEETQEKNSLPDQINQKKDHSKVLIVEDNADMRSYIKEQLKSDYQLVEAGNGQAGYEIAVKSMPDLIVTDLMMPKLDGISLCKKLKEDINTSHIPIIMLTAKAGLENKIEALETGADAYLTKPFNTTELSVQVKSLIEKCRKLRELFTTSVSIDPKELTITSLDEQLLQKVIDMLEERFSDSDFGITQMREELAMSNAQLHRKIKAITNQSPGELLRVFRLKKAAQILSNKGENVTVVAYKVGFNNLSYFAKCFKDFYGVSPSSY